MSNQTINLINNIVDDAVRSGVAKIKLENKKFDGKTIVIKGKELISFGSYSYLGLEIDQRLIDGAINSVKQYGIQYPSSRIYSANPMYDILLNQLKKIFGTEVVLTTSLSLGHSGVIPILIEREDILILDQYVHSSVQDAAERLKAKGIHVTVIRHNDIECLEQRIIEYSRKYRRIWYAIDGIYSMHGDTAPILALESLMNKYKKFHIYADDAHGVSSYGENGSGWILSKIKLHEKLFLTTGMAKAFGTMGGVFITKNKTFFRLVNNCTGSLIFSGPHPIPVLGASIKSAEIHLTPEIYFKQTALREKIEYCYDLFRKHNIPEISERETPIFFVPVSRLKAGYLLVEKMMNDGFFTNIASFPAVSESCTGVRFTISLHHTFKDIERLVFAFKSNYNKILIEERIQFDVIKQAFRKIYTFSDSIKYEFSKKIPSQIRLNQYSTIDEMPVNEQEKLMSSTNLFSIEFLRMYENQGRRGKKKEDKWSLFYLSVLDNNGTVILTTVFTVMIGKEDMLSSKDVSKSIELLREKDKYYLSSKILLMGTPITEGTHLFFNESHPLKYQALKRLIQETDKICEQQEINMTLYRDFQDSEEVMHNFLKGESFLPIEMPNNHEIHFYGNSIEEFEQSLSKKKRKFLRDRIHSSSDGFNISINDNPNSIDINQFHLLYKNVVKRGIEINTFPLNNDTISKILGLNDFKLFELKNETGLVVASILLHEAKESMTPIFIGLNYGYLSSNIYPVILWEVIKYANKRGKKRVRLGYAASQSKRTLGATVKKIICYSKSKDNYNQLLLNSHLRQPQLV